MQAPKLPRRLADLAQVFSYTGRRFLRDGGLQIAAALSYSSLLALVPLVTISFAILTAFEAVVPDWPTTAERLRAEIGRRLAALGRIGSPYSRRR